MKVIELRKMSEKSLFAQLAVFKKEHMNLRFRKSASNLPDTSRMRFVRRMIAKVNTVIVEKKVLV